MQFYFIRHAQSSNNLLWDTTGGSLGRSHDPELTETGLKQAQRVARFLARSPGSGDGNGPAPILQGRDYYNATGFGITHLYTSLMLRAVITGTFIAHEVGIPLLAWHDLHEFGGIYLADEVTGEPVGKSGNTKAYFEEHYPELVLGADCNPAGWWNRPYETREQALWRVESFARELLKRHGGTQDRVAVASHGDFYNMFLRLVFNIQSETCWFSLNNTGITRLDFEAEEVKMVYANRIDFLPPELVT